MRRILAAAAAVVLAILGAVLLVGYVGRADDRAMAGMETTTVLVASEQIPAGASAAEVADLVEPRQMPVLAAGPDALHSLDDVAGMVTVVDLQAGEQLLAARFADPAELQDPERAEVPAGLQEVTIQLDAQRVLGGTLKAGDRVGVIVSGTLEGEGSEWDGVKVTSSVLNQVLVTRVALTEETTTEDGQRAPQSLYVTLATTMPEAETVVFGMEHGTVWLTLQPEGPLEGGSQVITGEVIVR